MNKLEQNLIAHLAPFLPQHHIAQGYQYALLPPGKLFRPKLVEAIALDCALPAERPQIEKWDLKLPHAYLASALEIHHAYTLVHDDLPEMDNDQMRRGKPATHVKFGHWQALLVGDGLLSISYALLANLPTSKLPFILKLMGHLLGPKGLIQGQVLDLGSEISTFKQLLEVHTLKTARLIQMAIVGSFSLLESTSTKDYRKTLDLFRLGEAMGIVFQLLDDLTELTTFELPTHEQIINPWLHFKECDEEVQKKLKQIKETATKYKLNNFNKMVQQYYLKILSLLDANTEMIEHHIGQHRLNNIKNRLLALS